MNTWTMITAGGESLEDLTEDPMQRIRPRFIAGSANVDWLPADGRVDRHSAFGAKIEYLTDPAKKYAPEFEKEADLYVTDRRIVLVTGDVSSTAFGVASGLADWATRGAVNEAYDIGKRVGLRNRLYLAVQVDFVSLSVVRYYQASWPGRSLLQWSAVIDERNPYSRELVFTSLPRKVDVAGIAADILARAKRAKLRNEFGLFNPEQLRNAATVAFEPSNDAYMGHFTESGLSLPVLHAADLSSRLASVRHQVDAERGEGDSQSELPIRQATALPAEANSDTDHSTGDSPDPRTCRRLNCSQRGVPTTFERCPKCGHLTILLAQFRH